jgi:hypothetical protein
MTRAVAVETHAMSAAVIFCTLLFYFRQTVLLKNFEVNHIYGRTLSREPRQKRFKFKNSTIVARFRSIEFVSFVLPSLFVFTFWQINLPFGTKNR